VLDKKLSNTSYKIYIIIYKEVIIIKKNNSNYLDFIPTINPQVHWDTEDNLVILETSRNGIFDKIAQKIFKVPKKSHIKLDKHGSYVWRCIDGNRSIYDISKDVHKKFDKDAEPLLDRLVTFFNILHDNKFIKLEKGDSND